MSANKPVAPPAGKPPGGPPGPPVQPPGGPPAQPPGLQKAKLRIKGRWVEVEVKDRVKKAGLDWVMYVDDDGLETWQVA
jgi:hypothetical protein